MNRFPHAIYDSNITLHHGKYYKKWSERFRLFRTISLFSFVFALLVSIFFFSDSMTYDNIQLLANAIDSEYNSMFSEEAGGVSYNVDDSSVFELHDGNLVVATSSEVSLFGLSGRKLYSYYIEYENPRIVSSESLFIVYNLGGREFSVYNKTGQIHKGECEYIITSAEASNSGIYCITTKSRESNTSVLVYNKKNALIGKYDNSRRIADVTISNDGKNLAISTLTASDGQYNSVLSIYKIDNAKIIYTSEEKNKLPLAVYFTNNNKVMLCCSDEIITYNRKGDILSSYTYNADRLESISFNGNDKIAISFSYENSSTKSYINIVDTSGDVIYNNLNMDKVEKMSYYNDSLFILHNGSISKISDSKIEISEIETENIRNIFAISDENVLISYSSYSTVKNIN